MRKIISALTILVTLLAINVELSYAADPTTPPPIPPSSPTGVTVAGVLDTTAYIAWDPVPGATQYSVFISGRRWMGVTGPGVQLKDLLPNTEYTVYITAANDVGESGPSISVSFRTLPPKPTAPNSPIISQVNDQSATIQWDPLPPYENIKAYRIYVDGQPVADVQPQEGVQAAQLQNLASGVHTVAVAGVNDYGEGPRSAPVRFTVQTIPAPSGLRIYNRSQDTLWLIWDKLQDATKYQVLINSQVVGETVENTFTVKCLQPDQSYQIGLVAVYPDGNVSRTAIIQANTLPETQAITIEAFFSAITPYVRDFTPAFVIVFAIGAASLVARAASSIFRKRRWVII